MKRILNGTIFLAACLFVLTGCSNTKTLTCTKSATQEDFTLKETNEIEYEEDVVTKLTITREMKADKIEEEDFANAEDEAAEMDSLKGFTTKVTKTDTTIKMVTEIDYSKTDDKELGDKIGEEYKDSIYAKKIPISKMKDNFFKDYTCK